MCVCVCVCAEALSLHQYIIVWIATHIPLLYGYRQFVVTRATHSINLSPITFVHEVKRMQLGLYYRTGTFARKYTNLEATGIIIFNIQPLGSGEHYITFFKVLIPTPFQWIQGSLNIQEILKSSWYHLSICTSILNQISTWFPSVPPPLAVPWVSS